MPPGTQRHRTCRASPPPDSDGFHGDPPGKSHQPGCVPGNARFAAISTSRLIRTEQPRGPRGARLSIANGSTESDDEPGASDLSTSQGSNADKRNTCSWQFSGQHCSRRSGLDVTALALTDCALSITTENSHGQAPDRERVTPLAAPTSGRATIANPLTTSVRHDHEQYILHGTVRTFGRSCAPSRDADRR